MSLKTIAAALAAILLTACGLRAEDAQPAVLFVGSVHSRYVVHPLRQMGIEVDTCTPADMAQRLASKKYNVLVPYIQNDKSLQKPLEDFMAQGGGVLLNLPIGHISRANDWFPNPEWAAGHGAVIRWEQLADTDKANVVSDLMGATLSWSDQVTAPVNEGVVGVLTLVARTGWWPPLGVDFSQDWKVVVRWAPSVKGSRSEQAFPRLEKYVPARFSQGSTGLMGLRQVGKGRMALVGIGPAWSFASPYNCPTVEESLSTGVGGRKSDWLRVYANTFRWLAEPSLKAGFGGAATPDRLLNPQQRLADRATIDWSKAEPGPEVPPLADQPQLPGLIGARTELSGGKGAVADYARAAQEAGLSFVVFLEDIFKMDARKFDSLVQQCQAASSDHFAAVPGLVYEDAQGDHLYAFGDNARFPKPNLVLPDNRLATVALSRTEAVFKYVLEQMNYRSVFGFWRHKENFLPVADYKLYNSFPVFSHEDGRKVDDAFDEYLYLMGWGGCHAVLALEIMTSPDQVARRARDGWRVVAANPDRYSDGTYPAKSLPKGPKGIREKWTGSLGWWPPYQYITNGPEILSWTCQNNCGASNGQWWRPDVWQYRVRLHAASASGLKSVTIYDGDRGVYRRWLLGGAKQFQQDLVLSNCRQRDLVPVVEDVNGRRAIGMEIWNRNLVLNEYICGDRCNFLGNARLRRKDGSVFWTPCGFRANMGLTPSKGSMGEGLWVEPACSLTPGAPTLPIDGAPQSWPSPRVEIRHDLPGEYREVYTYPSGGLISPEMAVGQANYRLAYDSAEYGAKTTPLGHPYTNPEKQGQGGKNAWTSWYRLVPTKVLDGYSRLMACNTMDFVRFGGYEAHLVMKQDVALDPKKGMPVLNAGGKWEVYSGGKRVAPNEKGEAAGAFGRGTYALLASPGGSVAIIGVGDNLQYDLTARAFSLVCRPAGNGFKAGQAVDLSVLWLGASGMLPKETILKTIAAFGIDKPGTVGYQARFARGKMTDNYLLLHAAAQDGAIEAAMPKADLAALVPLVVEGLNDNWSVCLLDKARPWPNHRALPVRDGKCYAQLDLTESDSELFAGHPVVCDQSEVKLLVSWKQPGVWYVEAHNPTDKPLKAGLKANRGWTVFTFDETVDLPAGSSRIWDVEAR